LTGTGPVATSKKQPRPDGMIGGKRRATGVDCTIEELVIA
jgi:hypothetical protein